MTLRSKLHERLCCAVEIAFAEHPAHEIISIWVFGSALRAECGVSDVDLVVIYRSWEEFVRERLYREIARLQEAVSRVSCLPIHITRLSQHEAEDTGFIELVGAAPIWSATQDSP